MSFNVAITGATGFIGSAVLTELLQISANVTVLLRPETNRTRLPLCNRLKTITYSNLISHETVDALSEHQPDIFIHCGWRGVGGQQRNEAFQITENIPVALEAVELAAASGCNKWIGLGSQAEYGNQNRRL
jgi:UDP-glucose 4-epimerase